MPVIAHIGKIPIEEYAGFVVPVIALYAYGRAWSRRHRRKLASLPPASQALDEQTVQFVLARWAEDKHGELGREAVAPMYPPGPDGVTAAELAQRIGVERASVERGVAELAELGYLESDLGEGEQRLSLTAEGIHLLNITEDALLSAFADAATPERTGAS
ncbi:MAG TPA: helix-turn-helix domain-containing protein [Solirubrobacteraceae bacterium]|nr:helix-turn-helix domain-containing protein [Solirubrobacteraceae bacterium]